MKQTRFWLTTIATLLCSLTASAEDFSVDGIYYDITSSTKLTVAVTYRGSSLGDYFDEYSGAVTIPSTVTYNSKTYSVTSIKGWAFYNCSSLTSITISEGVTSIGSCAFRNCSSLTSITIPEGVTSIEGQAFSGCSSLASIVVAKGNTVYDSRNGCNAIIETSSNTLIQGCSATIIPESVTSIGDYAFSNCSGLVSITIPESVTSIGDWAFRNCSSLTSITLPESVTSIGSSAFEGTAWYNNQPDGVVYVGKVLYDYKGTMPENTSIEIEEGTLSISPYAFSGCSSLTSITLPESVTSIGSAAFKNCSSLTSITLLESVTSIGDDAFYNCTNLYEVLNFSDLDIRKGSSNHGYVAYYAQKVVVGRIIAGYIFTIKDGEYFLSDYVGGDIILSLPKDYNGEDYEIEEEAFKDNDSIVSVTIPQTVGTVGKSAFAECSNLKEVTLARGVMSIEDNAFENCTSLTSIQFPESLKTIGEEAFYGCSGLKDLFFSAKIETYGEGAFEGCTEVETLTVMGSVMPTVPSDKLTSITLFSPRPLETEPFANKVYRNATLYVPEGSLSRYQSADVWEDFWNIKEFDPTGIADVTVDEDADAPIYNMKGVRVNGTRSTLPVGLYIQNGKKFVVM